MNEQSKTLEQERIRGNQAQQVIESPLYREAWQKLEETLQQLRMKVPIADQTAHTRLILMEQLAGQLREFLEQTMQTGKLATLQMQTEQSRMDRLASAAVGYLRGR